jgi:hypothetical protein
MKSTSVFRVVAGCRLSSILVALGVGNCIQIDEIRVGGDSTIEVDTFAEKRVLYWPCQYISRVALSGNQENITTNETHAENKTSRNTRAIEDKQKAAKRCISGSQNGLQKGMSRFFLVIQKMLYKRRSARGKLCPGGTRYGLSSLVRGGNR